MEKLLLKIILINPKQFFSKFFSFGVVSELKTLLKSLLLRIGDCFSQSLTGVSSTLKYSSSTLTAFSAFLNGI